jgi:hypothetical protein
MESRGNKFDNANTLRPFAGRGRVSQEETAGEAPRAGEQRSNKGGQASLRILPPFIPPWAYRGPTRSDLVVPGYGKVDDALIAELAPTPEQVRDAVGEEAARSLQYGLVGQPAHSEADIVSEEFDVEVSVAGTLGADSPAAEARRRDELIPSISEFLVESSSMEPSLETQQPAHEEAAAALEEWQPVDGAAEGELSAAGLESEQWVAEERESFNWEATSDLAAQSNESLRAATEWANTDWDSPGPTDQGSPDRATDELAHALTRLAAQLRSGELKVATKPGESREAAIAAALSSFLQSRS